MARRGGYRAKLQQGDAPVFVTGGRWGVRRLRVDECVNALTAEHVYDVLIRNGRPMHPGECGAVDATDSSGYSWRVRYEIRANAVWRRGGRVFFRCDECGRLATRLYRPPVEGSAYRC